MIKFAERQFFYIKNYRKEETLNVELIKDNKILLLRKATKKTANRVEQVWIFELYCENRKLIKSEKFKKEIVFSTNMVIAEDYVIFKYKDQPKIVTVQLSKGEREMFEIDRQYAQFNGLFIVPHGSRFLLEGNSYICCFDYPNTLKWKVCTRLSCSFVISIRIFNQDRIVLIGKNVSIVEFRLIDMKNQSIEDLRYSRIGEEMQVTQEILEISKSNLFLVVKIHKKCVGSYEWKYFGIFLNIQQKQKKPEIIQLSKNQQIRYASQCQKYIYLLHHKSSDSNTEEVTIIDKQLKTELMRSSYCLADFHDVVDGQLISYSIDYPRSVRSDVLQMEITRQFWITQKFQYMFILKQLGVTKCNILQAILEAFESST